MSVDSAAPSGSNFNIPTALAIDGSGNVWATNAGTSATNGSVTELTGSGGLAGHYAPSGSNFSYPNGIAIDGSGNAWVANSGSSSTNGSATELTGSGALAGNYAPSGNTSGPFGIVIDGSGNAWMTNQGGNSVTELVGAAVPVVTPKVVNLIPTGSGGQYGGTSAVNRP